MLRHAELPSRTDAETGCSDMGDGVTEGVAPVDSVADGEDVSVADGETLPVGVLDDDGDAVGVRVSVGVPDDDAVLEGVVDELGVPLGVTDDDGVLEGVAEGTYRPPRLAMDTNSAPRVGPSV